MFSSLWAENLGPVVGAPVLIWDMQTEGSDDFPHFRPTSAHDQFQYNIFLSDMLYRISNPSKHSCGKYPAWRLIACCFLRLFHYAKKIPAWILTFSTILHKIFCHYASFFRISAIYNDFHCIYELFYPLFFTFLWTQIFLPQKVPDSAFPDSPKCVIFLETSQIFARILFTFVFPRGIICQQ